MKRTISDYFKKNASQEEPQAEKGREEEMDSVNEDNDDITREQEQSRQVIDEEIEQANHEEKRKKYSFQSHWLKQYPWLRYDGMVMTCVYCKKCGVTTAGKSKFVTGSTQFKSESMKLHGESKKHNTCRDRCMTTETLPSSFKRIENNNSTTEENEMIIKFNTAYNIAKEELPFSKFKSQILLMKKNGLNVNPTYANDVACAQFIGIIADNIMKKTAGKLSLARYLSFMVDSATDISTKECVIVYARIVDKGVPKNILIGQTEAEHAHAGGIYSSVKKAFASLGTEAADWLDKTVAMGADGAAVNLGQKGGVIAYLQAEAGSFIIPFHCMPHRLELGLLNVQREVALVGQVHDLLHLVWKTYHFSPKSWRELRALGTDLGVQVNSPGGVKGTRWLPHVSRSLNTLLKPGTEGSYQCPGQYAVVYTHMDHLASASTNADIAGRAKKVKNTMEDGTFVAFCYFLSDLFDVISKFSLLLQRNTVILPQAISGIETLLHTIKMMETKPKSNGRLADFTAVMKQSGDETIRFQGITHLRGDIDLSAPRLQKAIKLTCDATIKHLKHRFGSLLEEHIKDIPTAKAVRCFNVFNHHSWPDERHSLFDYGVKEVDFLLEHFSSVLDKNGCDKPKATEEFQELKMCVFSMFKDKTYLGLWEVMLRKEPYCTDFQNILQVVEIMLVLPVSSAVCERGFSAQNRIKSDVRARLHTDTVSDLIRISVEGPELADYDAKEDVKTWRKSGQRKRRPNYKSWPDFN